MRSRVRERRTHGSVRGLRREPLVYSTASRSTMVLTNRLISGENPNIGILLGVNETSVIPEFLK